MTNFYYNITRTIIFSAVFFFSFFKYRQFYSFKQPHCSPSLVKQPARSLKAWHNKLKLETVLMKSHFSLFFWDGRRQKIYTIIRNMNNKKKWEREGGKKKRVKYMKLDHTPTDKKYTILWLKSSEGIHFINQRSAVNSKRRKKEASFVFSPFIC